MYVSGFVAAVPAANRDAYCGYVLETAKVVRDHGALRFVECWGDDVPDGEVTSFPMAVECGPDETVALGWIEWPSREACDAAMPKVMQDPRLAPAANPMPFDGKRLIFGGFEVVTDERWPAPAS